MNDISMLLVLDISGLGNRMPMVRLRDVAGGDGGRSGREWQGTDIRKENGRL